MRLQKRCGARYLAWEIKMGVSLKEEVIKLATRVITSSIYGYQPCPAVSFASLPGSLTADTRPYAVTTSTNEYTISPTPTGIFQIPALYSESSWTFLGLVTIYTPYGGTQVNMSDGTDTQYLQRSGDITQGNLYVGYIVDDTAQLGSIFLIWQNTACNRNSVMSLLPTQAMYNAIIAEVEGNQWQNVDFGLSFQGTGKTLEFWTNYLHYRAGDEACNAEMAKHCDVNYIDSENFPTATLYTKGNYEIRAERGNFGPGYQCTLNFYYNGNRVFVISTGGNGSHRSNVCITFGINETTHRGTINFIYQSVSNYSTGNGFVDGTSTLEATGNSEKVYNWIKEAMPTVYNWVSVEKLVGKKKTFNLAKLKVFNNGDPVSGASSNNVVATTDALLSNMLGDITVDNTKVVVKYSIPEDTYTYVKLVYKKDDAPNNKDDGTVIDISSSSTSQIINGIADTSVWWFAIFTNKSQSNAVKFQAYKYTADENPNWRNVNLQIDSFNSSTILATEWFNSSSNDDYGKVYQNGTNIVSYADTSSLKTLFNNDIFKIRYSKTTSGSTVTLELYLFYENTQIGTNIVTVQQADYIGLGFGVSNSLQQGQVMIASHNTAISKYITQNAFASNNTSALEALFKAITQSA